LSLNPREYPSPFLAPLFADDRDFVKRGRGREVMNTGFISPKDMDFSGLKFNLKAL
jgi:hypothetical protein